MSYRSGRNTQYSIALYRNCLQMKEGESFMIVTPDEVRIFELKEVLHELPTVKPDVIYDELLGSEGERSEP